MNDKFELFMCCLGNGVTVCNKAVMEHGDYKIIAHISNYGKIKLYVKKSYIPERDMRKIEKAAFHEKEKFLEWWNKLPTIKKYEKLLDELPITTFLELVGKNSGKLNGLPLNEKVKYLEKLFT